MSTIRLLSFAGSLRAGSFNQQLVDRAAEIACRMGVEVTRIELADFPLPLYSQQLEDTAFPDAARELKALFVAHAGFLVASPEYNSSVSGVLKNAIDWVSRPTEDEGDAACSAFRNKVVGLMSASVGALGGMRGQQHLRQILGALHALVATQQVAVPFADKAFAGGALIDPVAGQALPLLVGQVLRLTRALADPA